MLNFRLWEARRNNPNQPSFDFDQDVMSIARSAIEGIDVSTINGKSEAMKVITSIAKEHGLSPNELWRDLMYEPEGMAHDIEGEEEKPFRHSRPSSEEAFVSHLVDEFRKHGKKAISVAKEYQNRNPKMSAFIQKAIDKLSS